MSKNFENKIKKIKFSAQKKNVSSTENAPAAKGHKWVANFHKHVNGIFTGDWHDGCYSEVVSSASSYATNEQNDVQRKDENKPVYEESIFN